MQHHDRPYGLLTILDHMIRIAVAVMLAGGGYLLREVKIIGERQQKVLEWKESIPERMQTEAEKLRLQVLTEVTSTLGVALGQMREGQVEIKVKLENIDKKLDDHMNGARK